MAQSHTEKAAVLQLLWASPFMCDLVQLLFMYLYLVRVGWGGKVQDSVKSLLKPWASHTIKFKSHLGYEARMEKPSLPEKAGIVSRGFPCATEYGVMHYIFLPNTHSPPLSWSLKDIAYKRDDSRRRPSSVVLLHLGATAACLWRDKVVPFSFCILRPIF